MIFQERFVTFVISFWKPDGNGKKIAPAGFSAGAVVRSVCSRDFAISRMFDLVLLVFLSVFLFFFCSGCVSFCLSSSGYRTFGFGAGAGAGVTVSDTETALCAVGSYRKVCFIACIFSLF